MKFSFDLELIFVVVLILFLLVAADTVRKHLKESGNWHNDEHAQEETAPATVTRTWWSNEILRNGVKKVYYVQFELENGEQLKFRVQQPTYFDLFEGDTGMLRYEKLGEGKLFRDFKKSA